MIGDYLHNRPPNIVRGPITTYIMSTQGALASTPFNDYLANIEKVVGG